jgi:hypothetical protein
VNCFKCAKKLELVFGEHDLGEKAPSHGLRFTASGNYGSRIWDPTHSAPVMVVWICDDCIDAHKELVELRTVVHAEPQIVWEDYEPGKEYW